MSTANYISIIERYHEYRAAIHDLMASILNSIGEEHLFEEKSAQCKAIERLGAYYPFIELFYILDTRGVQISDNIAVTSQHPNAYSGRGTDRSQRPYYRLALQSSGVVVTEPYLSSKNCKLCISAAARVCHKKNGSTAYLVLDIDLAAVVEFLMGDSRRRHFQPLFKSIYSVIVAGLMIVVATLIYAAGSELLTLFFSNRPTDLHLKPFGVIIFLTLALAVFDLGKTTLEEEVLMHKDIFRHSSTRRTITRFIAAILIAVSIEALLLMFKSALGDQASLVPAVWMMLAAVGLLIGLGIYVYLGARAEAVLLSIRRPGSTRATSPMFTLERSEPNQESSLPLRTTDSSMR